MKKKALLYTSNTDKLVNLAQFLVHDDWEIISAGSTADFLKKQNIRITVEKSIDSDLYTDDSFSKILTMLLIAGHDFSKNNTAEKIRLVCINLDTGFRPLNDFKEDDKLDNCIDLKTNFIIRSAAKNYNNVMLLTDPADYDEAIVQLRNNNISSEFCLYLAGKALNMTSAYDAASANSILYQKVEFPNYFLYPLKKVGKLRHGMNQQQAACLYSMNDNDSALSGVKKIYGKELSFPVFQDCLTAWKYVSMFMKVLKNPFSVQSFDCNNYPFVTHFTPASGYVFTIGIKNNNPIGASLGEDILDSFRKTYNCDKLSFEGATLGCSAVINEESAQHFLSLNLSAIIAPDFSKEARKILSEEKNLRLVIASRLISGRDEYISIDGGVLVQQQDHELFKRLRVMTRTRPTQSQFDAMEFGMLLAMLTTSNSAIVINDLSTAGISTGQPNRYKAVKYALDAALECQKNGLTSEDKSAEILVSDSVIDFDEKTRMLADLGIKAIIQTGGTPHDNEFIDFCNEKGISMVFTGIQHLAY